jgi:hypothetical protein
MKGQIPFRMAPVVLIIVAMASVVGTVSAKAIDPRQFEVVGLTLFKDEMKDVDRKLGLAVDSHPPGSDFPERCYASPGKDGTLLVLENWTGTLVGFRIYRASPTDNEKCTRTSAVSGQISTAGGLRLGLTMADVLKLLGTPTKKTSNSFTYHEDVASRIKGKEGLFEYTEIDLRFADSKLVSIHVVHTVRD